MILNAGQLKIDDVGGKEGSLDKQLADLKRRSGGFIVGSSRLMKRI